MIWKAGYIFGIESHQEIRDNNVAWTVMATEGGGKWIYWGNTQKIKSIWHGNWLNKTNDRESDQDNHLSWFQNHQDSGLCQWDGLWNYSSREK